MIDPWTAAANEAYSKLARERAIEKRDLTVPDLIEVVIAAVLKAQPGHIPGPRPDPGLTDE